MKIDFCEKVLASGGIMKFRRKHYNRIIGIAEKVSKQSEYSNGIIIFGDEDPNYMNVKIWLVPKNTV